MPAKPRRGMSQPGRGFALRVDGAAPRPLAAKGSAAVPVTLEPYALGCSNMNTPLDPLPALLLGR
jgi:hypothetical protein